MLYFAYGSNMLKARLTARVPNAKFYCVVRAVGRILTFEKRSNDNSGKCHLRETGNESDLAYGVLFDVPDSERYKLDEAEGLGHGYKDAQIEVFDMNSTAIQATGYFATDIDPNLVPYDWYHCLVLNGAKQNNLPAEYISLISAIRSVRDPDPTRDTRLKALKALKEAGVEYTECEL